MFQIALDYLKTLYSGTRYIKKKKKKQKASKQCIILETSIQLRPPLPIMFGNKI